MTKAPQLGLTARATLSRIIDGDTVDIEIRLPARVRLLDCWAPEKSTPEGTLSSQALSVILEGGDEMVVFIPTDEACSLKDVMTFGRVLGQLWANPEAVESVSELMVRSGNATKEKA